MKIENRIFDELQVGDSQSLRRLCTQDDLLVFANVSGNHNPMHLYDVDGDGDGQPEAYVPGMFLGSLISAVLGNLLPGAGTLYRAQSLEFHNHALAGDEVESRVTVTDRNTRDMTVTLATEVRRLRDDALIVSGVAVVEAPRRKLNYSSHDLPGLIVQRHRHFEKLLKRAEPLAALVTAVVCPEEPNSLGGALRAQAHTAGLRTGRRLSHVFVMDVPGLAHLLLVTDAAINITPDLRAKVDIVQNAIDLALSLGIKLPKVGVLSAVETVNPDLPSSIDAALLSKMAERGQITGGLVDGPLAMDNAVDLAAARTKGLSSPVAGRADILVVPNLDAGNMLAKQLTYLSHAEAAGVVLGARVPIILNSRADDDMARLASCAVAALHHARLNGRG